MGDWASLSFVSFESPLTVAFSQSPAVVLLFPIDSTYYIEARGKNAL